MTFLIKYNTPISLIQSEEYIDTADIKMANRYANSETDKHDLSILSITHIQPKYIVY